MARKHTIFIGALCHVAIATLESDSPTLDKVVPAMTWSLSSTLRLPGLGKMQPKIGEVWDSRGLQLMSQSVPRVLFSCRSWEEPAFHLFYFPYCN